MRPNSSISVAEPLVARNVGIGTTPGLGRGLGMTRRRRRTLRSLVDEVALYLGFLSTTAPVRLYLELKKHSEPGNLTYTDGPPHDINKPPPEA